MDNPLHAEAAYRRGFQQAYNQAILTFLSLVSKGDTPQSAWEKMADFSDRDLRDWRFRRHDQMTPPTFRNPRP